MKNLLVIDTCGATGYVAVCALEPSGSVAPSERRLGVRTTQEELLPAIEAVLADEGVSLAELAAVVVVSGPGSFTGVRIGIAAAKGLCEAQGLPLVMLSRLQVLAHAGASGPAWAWLAAGRGEVYSARFGGPAEQTVKSDATHGSVRTLQQAVDAAAGEPVLVCEEQLRDAVPTATFVPEAAFASALRAAATAAVHAGVWADVALADAMYLRVPDAVLAREAKQG